MRVASSVLAALGISLAGCGASSPPEWRVLFDGKTLTGWEAPGESWVVADGCIQAVKAPRIREDLLTSDSFGDFDLEFEWRIAPGGNSGLKYRIQDRGLVPASDPVWKKFEDRLDHQLRNRVWSRDKIPAGEKYEDYLVGFEYQLIDNQGHPDAAAPERRTGSIYSMVAPVKQTARPVGEFNQSRIVLRGNRVEHWLNGEKVVDTDLQAPAIAAGLARRWTTASPVYELLTKQPKKRTPLGLQNHGDEVWFRNLRIRER